MIAFIDDHRGRFGVEPICRVLNQHGVPIAPSGYYAARHRPPSARAVRDARALAEIERVFYDRDLGRGLYGRGRCGRSCATKAAWTTSRCRAVRSSG